MNSKGCYGPTPGALFDRRAEQIAEDIRLFESSEIFRSFHRIANGKADRGLSAMNRLYRFVTTRAGTAVRKAVVK